MDTEGSSDEDNGEVTRKIPDSIGVQSSFQSEDGSSSSNLVSTSVVTGSDVIPNRISAAMLKEERSETSSYGSKSYNSNANREILSRQKILSMVSLYIELSTLFSVFLLLLFVVCREG